MKDSILIIDNHAELQAIEKEYPDLKSARLILISGNFSKQNISSYKRRGYCFFDKSITLDDSISITKEVKSIVWSWFLDENDKDISSLEGCSLGSSFSHSVEILLITTFKYLVSFKKILSNDLFVYCSSEIESICLETLKKLEQEIGFTLNIVETINTSTIITQGKRKMRMDVRGRFRDHSKVFLKTSAKQKLMFYLMLFIQSITKGTTRKNVLFVPAGKHKSYFKHIRENTDTYNFKWIIPLSRFKDLITVFGNKISFFYLSSTGKSGKKDIERIIADLKINLLKKKINIDKNLLIHVLDSHIFIYFYGAYNYFNNSLKTLITLSPKLVILSSESSESFVLIGQAAKKIKIKTAFLPHGIYGIGRSQYKAGRFGWIDYGFALGKLDREKFLISKMPENNIFLTGHPHFESFLPIKRNLIKRYKRVILLPPDAGSRKSGDKITYEYDFYNDIFKLMRSLSIEIVCIKARDSRHLKSRSMVESVKIGNMEVPVVADESTLADLVNEVDFVIGPLSTAIIEIGLMGVDYYVFDYTAFELLDDFELCTHKYMNISDDTFKLKKYIEMKAPYKNSHSVFDLIDINKNSIKNDIVQKLENSIETILFNET